MRAVAIASDRTLQVVDIDRPVPGTGEVLLDVSFCGVCGSDLNSGATQQVKVLLCPKPVPSADDGPDR